MKSPAIGQNYNGGGGGSRFVKPPLHQIYGANGRNDSRLKEVAHNLSRARSKDYIHYSDSPSGGLRNNRYGGASGIIEAGRQES